MKRTVGETVTQYDNPIRMVREFKGAPLSIIMVLSMVQQRVTQEYLERSTGYTDKPVSQALAYLQEIGLADHTRSGWQLIKSDRLQLPLPLALEGEDLGQAEPDREYKNADELSRNISDSIHLRSYILDPVQLVVNSHSPMPMAMAAVIDHS